MERIKTISKFLTTFMVICLMSIIGVIDTEAQEIQSSDSDIHLASRTNILLEATVKSSSKESKKNRCGKNLTWKYSNGTLTIWGKGKMYDYPYTSYDFGDGSIRAGDPNKKLPWYKHKDSIKKVVIKKGVTGIGEAAFGACSKLETVTIPISVTTIGKDAFRDCVSLKTIRLPDKLKEISEGVFDRCSKLQSVYIPQRVENIGAYAFCQCTSLTFINLPDNLKNIGIYTFQSCGFKTVKIPNNVKHIDSNAFSFNSNLESVTLPNSVKEIRSFAFYACLKLSDITIINKTCKIDDSSYTIDSKDVVIHAVNGSTAQLYAKKYSRKFNAIDCVTKITLSGKKVIKAGKSTTVKAKVAVTSPNANKALAWSTSNKKYATVNSNGKVVAKKAGKGKTVTITAVAKDGSGTAGRINIKIK